MPIGDDDIRRLGEYPAPETLRKLPRAVLAELEGLKKYDAKIRAALARPQTARLFFSDPAAALREIGIALSPELEKLLKERRPAARAARAKRYIWPNGQTVTPKVTVRFRQTGGR